VTDGYSVPLDRVLARHTGMTPAVRRRRTDKLDEVGPLPADIWVDLDAEIALTRAVNYSTKLTLTGAYWALGAWRQAWDNRANALRV
jgi:hypothetical protein